MEISEPFAGCRSPGSEVHVHVVVNDLEEFSGLGDAARLYLGPDGHVVQTDLEGPGADELGLHRVTQEESHHAGVDLVLQHPSGPGWSLNTEEGEGVEGGQNHHYEENLQDTEYLCSLQSVATRGEVVATDGDFWVFLLQYTGILLKYLLITSGVAVEELDGRPHELGQLRLGNVLLSVKACLTRDGQDQSQDQRPPTTPHLLKTFPSTLL